MKSGRLYMLSIVSGSHPALSVTFFYTKKKKIYNIFCQKIWLNIFSGIFSLNIFYSQDLNSTYLKRIILDHLDLLFSLNDSTLVLKITSSFLLHYIGL